MLFSVSPSSKLPRIYALGKHIHAEYWAFVNGYKRSLITLMTVPVHTPLHQDGTVVKYPPEVSKRPVKPPLCSCIFAIYAVARDFVPDRKAPVTG